MKVAIPHVKLPGLESVAVSLSVHPEGVAWKATDGDHVHLFFTVLRPDRQGEQHDPDRHLEMMRWVARLARDAGTSVASHSPAKNKKELVDLLKEKADVEPRAVREDVELRRTVSVCNRQGLHARPCHAVVSITSGFSGELRVTCGDTEVNGKSILELMTLNASCGSTLELRASGEGAAALLDALEELVRSGFGESSAS